MEVRRPIIDLSEESITLIQDFEQLTEDKRIVKISVFMDYTYGYMERGEVKTANSCSGESIFTLTLKRMGKMYIIDCEPYKNSF